MCAVDRRAREQDLRDFLGGFDFRGDMVDAAVGRFSGGEKSRLTLALIIWQRPNLLLLDEPTNHLDLEMRQALTMALQDFEGAMVLVSHDRHLLRASTDTLLLVADGACAPFDGDLDDYRDWLQARRRQAEGRPAEAAPGPSRREQRRRGGRGAQPAVGPAQAAGAAAARASSGRSNSSARSASGLKRCLPIPICTAQRAASS